MKRRRRITRARLQKLLHYDEETGEFHWQERMSQTVQAGDIAGYVDGARGYRDIMVDGRTYSAHRLVWLHKTGKQCPRAIDHRDRNPSNNRWDNLRSATVSQNNANRRRQKNNRSGFKGVIRLPSGRWRAVIHKNRRQLHLGMFATAEEAHAAYVAAAHKLFGEFARPE